MLSTSILSDAPAFFVLEGRMPMKQIKDLNNKRVCDLSDDRKVAYVRRGDCMTRISVEEDGSLKITFEIVHQAS